MKRILMMQKRLDALAIFLLLLSGPACAYEASYISLSQVNLAKLLAPPPTPQSNEQKLDLIAVLQTQKDSTASQRERAVADNELSVFRIAEDVLGPNFTPERAPKTAAFFDRIWKDYRDIILATKDVWDRPRPYTVSTDVKPIGKLETSGSYPSGHATRGYLAAIILSNMLPEKKESLFARAREYGNNRVVAGDHFPSDVEAGRFAATALAVAFIQNEKFSNDFAEAKAELRSNLGLSPQ
jgi:acid phosphatase (class A)